MIQADGARSYDELATLSRYYRDTFDFREEDEWVKSTAESSPDALRRIPTFIEAACRQDKALGSTIASAMVADVEQLCVLIGEADGDYSEREIALATAVAQTLRQALGD